MQLTYQQYGETGPPLLVLHGLLGSSDNWRTLCRRFFSKQFQVFAVDLRNHGASPHRETLSYPEMADDLLQFSRSHQLSPAHILGHSMGGKVAMQFALNYPAEVRKLIVADIAPRAYAPHHQELLDALYKLDLAEITSRQEADQALARAIPQRSVRQFLLKNLNRTDANGYEWQMNLEAIRSNYHQITAAIGKTFSPFSRPALFIRGGRSNYVEKEDEREIMQLFPGADIVTIPQAGHWVHAEAPETFAQKVTEFLT